MLKIGFPIPTKEDERRRALTPEHVRAIRRPEALVFEETYGAVLGYEDDAFRKVGAEVADRGTVCASPVICNPKPTCLDEYYKPGKVVFGWIHAVQGRGITDMLLHSKATAIAWEEMYENGRHVFYKNNELSGEAAIVHAFLLWGRAPYGARVALVGRGNVARGAFRALERAGALVTVYDRRTSPALRLEISRYDVIVNAVMWDVFREDHIIYTADLQRMRRGSMIIDISCDEGMGVESSRPTTIAKPVYWHGHVLHYAVDHTPALYFKSATDEIGAAVVPYINDLSNGNWGEALSEATVIRDGAIFDERISRFQGR